MSVDIFKELKLFFFAFCQIWVVGQLNSNNPSVNGMNNGALAAVPYRKDCVCVCVCGGVLRQNLLITVVPSKTINYCFPSFSSSSPSFSSFLPNLLDTYSQTYICADTNPGFSIYPRGSSILFRHLQVNITPTPVHVCVHVPWCACI